MRAYVTIPLKEFTEPISKVKSVAHGLKLPYMSQNGIPVFTLETDEDSLVSADYMHVVAQPGMIGITLQGQIYCIDNNDDAQPLALHFITVRQWERLTHLEDSFIRETV